VLQILAWFECIFPGVFFLVGSEAFHLAGAGWVLVKGLVALSSVRLLVCLFLCEG
jgi:hypothetical protein